jgi:hypothetical protein
MAERDVFDQFLLDGRVDLASPDGSSAIPVFAPQARTDRVARPDSVVRRGIVLHSGQMDLSNGRSGVSIVGVRTLRGAPIASPALPSRVGEWLLACAFSASYQLMRAAAQFCGILLLDGGAQTLGDPPTPDLQTLCQTLARGTVLAAIELFQSRLNRWS